MHFSNNEDHMALTSNLSGGGTVAFDVTNPYIDDTPEENPIEFWLDVMPTAAETDPD